MDSLLRFGAQALSCSYWAGYPLVVNIGRMFGSVSAVEWMELMAEICSQVENGLFTLTGVGLIPWRAIDTYRKLLSNLADIKVWP
jgi:hypothetical protein